MEIGEDLLREGVKEISMGPRIVQIVPEFKEITTNLKRGS